MKDYVGFPEVARRCSVKKVFLEISQNSQESNNARVSFLLKLQARPAALVKKRLGQACNFSEKRLCHRCFPVNFVKFPKKFFYRTPSGDCLQLSTQVDCLLRLRNL